MSDTTFFAVLDQKDHSIKAAYETWNAAKCHVNASDHRLDLRIIEVSLEMLLRCYSSYLETIRRYA